MIKNLIFLILVPFFVNKLNAQSITIINTNDSITEKEIKEPLPFIEKGTRGWYKMKPNSQITVNDLLNNYLKELGFGADDKWVEYRKEKDELGIIHHRYQQYHKNIEVHGAILLIHEKAGFVLSFNGDWTPRIDLNGKANITKEESITYALKHFPADRYIWEDKAAEKMIRRIEKNEDATFYPQPELVWVQTNAPYARLKIHLAYKMEIHAQIPLLREEVYINSTNGELLKSVDLIHHKNVKGTAITKYHGQHDIITDSVGPNEYRLRETTRGHGIETYDMNTSKKTEDAVDFIDSDNYWNNVNPEQDEAATDVHWGSQMTFDYFQTKHNYIGVDNDSMALISYVHYDTNLTNAFWNGKWATFGDGDSKEGNTALTTLDVVAHEFGHGITEFSADLVYLNEPGALNESFSDIIGILVEHWAIPKQSNWRLGEQFIMGNSGLRNMSNPNALNHPDTYFGNRWYVGPLDHGGVHWNSGVQNYWFYLLSVGGSGRNDNNQMYQVDGLGYDTAGAIALRNLRYYLSVNSTYVDAREGALQAAEDLYGACSYAYIQTSKAWYAVGLGSSIELNDIRPVALLAPTSIACGVTNQEYPHIQIRYNGCYDALTAEHTIPIAFQLDNGPIVLDTIELVSTLKGGDKINYISDKSITGLEVKGEHNLRVWTSFQGDPNRLNDTLDTEILTVLKQNSDFAMESLEAPVSNCFLGMEKVKVNIGFYGCDSIEMGTNLKVSYRMNGGNIKTENYTLPKTIYSRETFDYSFTTNIDFTNATGRNEVESWVELSSDFQNNNDTLDIQFITNPKRMVEDNLLTFEVPESFQDSVHISTKPISSVFVSIIDSASGNKGLQMSGGDAITNLFEMRMPRDGNNWEINKNASAKTCFCVNATEMNNVILSFDLKQGYSAYWEVLNGVDINRSSSLRVLVENEQISETYNPETNTDDTFTNLSFNLTKWANTSFEVCIETRNLLAKEYDPVGDGDNAFIDNIKIEGVYDTDKHGIGFSSIRALPNPTHGNFELLWYSRDTGNATISIFDSYGRNIKVQAVEYNVGVNTLPLNLKNQATGIYFVKIFDGEKSKTVKLVKI